MRKILIAVIVMLFVTLGISCGKKKEATKYTVTIHYDEITKQVEFEENSTFAYEALDTDNYLFLGWYNEDYTVDYSSLIITGNVDVYAKLERKGVEYKITYVFDGGYFKNVVKYKYTVGTSYTLEKPCKDNHFEFAGWEYNGEIITEISDTMYGDITITATWIDRNVYHTITYNFGADFSEATWSADPVKKFAEGESVKLAYPIYAGYYFRGWYLEDTYTTRVREVTTEEKSDLTLYAKWEVISRQASYVSILGDSISTFEGEIPEGYVPYYPCEGCDVKTKEDTWWYKLFKKIKYNLLVNGSYSGTRVSNGTAYGASDERINALSAGDTDPDIIFIHMGTNDYTNGVEIKTFRRMYEEMIKKIKERYDDVIIYVFTHPLYSYTGFEKKAANVNAAIVEVAELYDLHIIDMANQWTKVQQSNYMFAGAHLNANGMTYVADYIYEGIMDKKF